MGDEVEVDKAEAVAWYVKSANQGFAKAQNNLGNAYFSGFGLHISMQQARYWWGKAAKQGEPHAVHNLNVAMHQPVI